MPRAFVINWMDRELADFERAMESITAYLDGESCRCNCQSARRKDFAA